MSELKRFCELANIASRVHGNGLSLDAVTCVKMADEYDELQRKLELAVKVMQRWMVFGHDQISIDGMEMAREMAEALRELEEEEK